MRKLLLSVLAILSAGSTHGQPGPKIHGSRIDRQSSITISSLSARGAGGVSVTYGVSAGSATIGRAFSVGGSTLIVDNGRVSIGTTTANLPRNDTVLDVVGSGPTGAGTGIVVTDSAFPWNSNMEAFYAMYAFDSLGRKLKTSSISSKFIDDTAGTGYSALRLNATYNGGTADDIFLRGWGNNGAAFWNGNDTVPPGPNNLLINGQTITTQLVTTSSAAFGGTAGGEKRYVFQAISNGAEISGTDLGIGGFLSGDQSHGVILGFDSASRLGTITSQGANSGISIWTHNGTWAERLRVHTNGNVCINCTSPASKLHISSGTITIDGTGAPKRGQALCLAAGGALGHCTSAIGASGGCTCVSP